LQLWGLLLC